MRMAKYSSLFFTAMLFMMVSCNMNQSDQKVSTEAEQATIDDKLIELNQAILSDADNDVLYIERADYYLFLNKTDSALRDILFAIDIDDKNADHYNSLSDAYLAMGNPDKCYDALEKAVQLDPKNQEALLKKAQLYLIMRSYDKTYSTLDELLAEDKFAPIAYFVRAMAMVEQADTAGAIKNLQIAIDQKQDYYEAQLQLGVLFSRQGNPIAVNYLQNAIELMPQSIESYYQLALFFQENASIASAVKTYNSILDIQPEYIPALYNLGYISLVYEQDFRKASDYFTQVVQLSPEYAEAFYNRGYSYELMGQYDLARKDYTQTLKLSSNYALAIEALNRLDKQ